MLTDETKEILMAILPEIDMNRIDHITGEFPDYIKESFKNNRKEFMKSVANIENKYRFVLDKINQHEQTKTNAGKIDECGPIGQTTEGYTYTNPINVISIRTGSLTPTLYRLVKRNGELLLEGGYRWEEGIESGIEWKVIPTIDFDRGE